MIKNFFYASIFLVSTVCNVVVAAPSLCTVAESMIFSCPTAASKITSLCENKKNRMITYRYGRIDRIEMSYTEKGGVEGGFSYSHYFRSNVDYFRIKFRVDEYEYSIFRDYDAADN